MRALLAAALLGALCLLAPASALAHAVVVRSSPAADEKLAAAPPEVRIVFNEPVQLLKPGDISVVDRQGNPVTAGPGSTLPSDTRVLRVSLQPGLANGTYTVRYLIVSADSHVIAGYFVFGVGPGELAAPFLGGAGQRGPSENSPWAVVARLLELVGLGGLFGLVSVRWLVWRGAWRGMPALPDGAATRLLVWERDAFWTGFGTLALGAMLAEGYLLVVKSASGLGVSVLDVVQNPTDVSTMLRSTRFGDLVQGRGALLFLLFALGAWRFLAESSDDARVQPSRPAGSPVAAAAMAAVSLAAIALVSVQGHASQAPLSPLQVAVDVIHVASVAVWIVGLVWVLVAMRRLPRIAAAGALVAGRCLARFSRVALAVVALAVATGVVRSAAELSDPAQLWDTAYGRSILYKVLLLCPIAYLALRNRRIVTSLRTVDAPNAATLRMVRRNVALEVTFAFAVVVVASVLVAQVPGRV